MGGPLAQGTQCRQRADWTHEFLSDSKRGTVMRSDVLRLAGLCGLLFAIVMVIVFIASIASGISLHDKDVGRFLTDINNNEGVFVVSQALLGIGYALVFPLLLGLFFALREEDRPFSILASTFFAIGILFMVAARAIGGVLTGVASDFVASSGAVTDAILQDGETLQTIFIVLQGVGEFGVGLGLLVTGVLMLRAPFFSRWLSWFTIVIGISGLPGFLFFIFLPGLVIWFLAVSATMLSKSMGARAAASA